MNKPVLNIFSQQKHHQNFAIIQTSSFFSFFNLHAYPLLMKLKDENYFQPEFALLYEYKLLHIWWKYFWKGSCMLAVVQKHNDTALFFSRISMASHPMPTWGQWKDSHRLQWPYTKHALQFSSSLMFRWQMLSSCFMTT